MFDVYNIFHRVFFGNENITKIDNKLIPIDAICKYFELCDSYIEKYGIKKDCKIYWLMDNAKSRIINRKFIDENYKKNRKEMPEEFYNALNIIELILKFYRDGVLYRKQGIEADDYVSNIIDNYIDEHDHVLLFSNDMDWSRCLLNDVEHDIKVDQYIKNNEILTVKNFEEKYGFKPTISNITFFKCFYGDKADNIPSTLSNFPKEYFLDVLKRYNHVDSFIKDSLEGKIKYLDSGWKIKIQQLQDRMRINWNLISAINIEITDLENWKIECSYKPNKLLIIYSTLNVVGRFDKRVKVENKETSIWQMLNGETLDRADV
jgi:5'-3' exonuclease